MGIGHHPIRRDHETRSLEYFLAGLRDTTDLDHTGPRASHHQAVGQCGIRWVHVLSRRGAQGFQCIRKPRGTQQCRHSLGNRPQPVRRVLVHLGNHLGAANCGSQTSLARRCQRATQQPGGNQDDDQLQHHPDDRVDDPHRRASDRTAHSAAQHHTGNLPDHHQYQDQEKCGE